MTVPSFSCLLWVVIGAAAPASGKAVDRAARQVVDYFHARGDVSVHGTISNLDGVVRSTWTITRRGDKETFDQRLGVDGFRSLVAGFSLPELRQYEVTRNDQRLDFVAFQVISLVLLRDDGTIDVRRTFLVPASPASRKIVAWLRTANVPPH